MPEVLNTLYNDFVNILLRYISLNIYYNISRLYLIVARTFNIILMKLDFPDHVYNRITGSIAGRVLCVKLLDIKVCYDIRYIVKTRSSKSLAVTEKTVGTLASVISSKIPAL